MPLTPMMPVRTICHSMQRHIRNKMLSRDFLVFRFFFSNKKKSMTSKYTTESFIMNYASGWRLPANTFTAMCLSCILWGKYFMGRSTAGGHWGKKQHADISKVLEPDIIIYPWPELVATTPRQLVLTVGSWSITTKWALPGWSHGCSSSMGEGSQDSLFWEKCLFCEACRTPTKQTKQARVKLDTSIIGPR